VFDLLIERFSECKVEDRNNEPSKNNVRAFAKMLIDCLLKFMLFKTNVSPEKNNGARLIFRIQFFQNLSGSFSNLERDRFLKLLAWLCDKSKPKIGPWVSVFFILIVTLTYPRASPLIENDLLLIPNPPKALLGWVMIG
jgi:hypothetical protein